MIKKFFICCFIFSFLLFKSVSAANYHYDQDGRLISETSGSDTTEYTYWDDGTVKTMIRKSGMDYFWGSITENTYDEQGRLVSFVEKNTAGEVQSRGENVYENGKTTSITRDSQGNITGGSVDYYNSTGKTVKHEELGSGGSVNQTYMYTFDEGTGRQLSWTIQDSEGNVIREDRSIYLPSGQVKTYYTYPNDPQNSDVINMENGVVTSVDHYSNGTVTGSDVFEYVNGKLVSATYDQWGTERHDFDYDGSGNIKSEIITDSYSTSTKMFNEEGKVASERVMYGDSFGSFTEYEYFERDGDQYIRTTSKNEDGSIRSVSELNPRTSIQTTWDGNGNMTMGSEETVDENGNKVAYSYYGSHDYYTKSEYDDHGNLTKSTMLQFGYLVASTEYEYVYDGENVVQKSMFYNGQLVDVWTYDYDSYGNLVKASSGSAVDEYFYDDPNWVANAKHRAWLANRKLIYTVDEAEKVSKPTGNTFRIRYK